MGRTALITGGTGRLDEGWWVVAPWIAESERASAILPTVIDSPAGLADVIAFLFSDQARSITGAQIPVPGVA
jgi:NAD(P)-dependent dehydrogenase (short-subunit alcohol dehydrogenase family)